MSFAHSGLTIYFSEPRFSRMVFYSLLVHLFLFGVIVGIPPSQRNIDFAPFYTVDLVNLPASMLQHLSATTGTEAQTSLVLPATTKSLKKSSPQEKDSSKELDATLARIREKVARERARSGDEEIAKIISQIRGKIAVKGEGGFSNIKGSPSGVAQVPSALPSGSYQMNLYLTVIWEKIRSSWNLAENLVQRKKDLESIIAIKISRKGEIVDTNFEKRSGNHYLDESAMRAIKKANPLPPLPDAFRDEYLEIGIRFIPSDLG